MINLIRADLFSLRKSKVNMVLLGVTIMSSVVMAVMAYLIPQGKIDESLTGLGFLFSDANMISIVGAVIASVIICGDYENKTIHDAIATGSGRGAIIVSKAIVVSCALVLILLPYAITTGIAWTTGSEFSMGSVAVGFLHLLTAEAGAVLSGADIVKLVGIMLTMIIVYVAQLSLCVPLAFVLKKPVLVVAINYGVTILSAQLTGMAANSSVVSKLISWTPYAGDYAFMSLDTGAGIIFKAWGVSMMYIVIMLVIAYSVFRRSELK